MNLIEALLWVITILCSFTFAYFVVKIWYSLRTEDKNTTAINSLKTEVGKLKSSVNKLSTIKVPSKYVEPSEEVTDVSVSAGQMPNFQNMTIEDLAEFFGVSEKDYNNPLVRPFLDKMLVQFKQKQAQTGTTEGF